MRLEIEVTQEDIDSGMPRNAVTCPIATAAARQTGYSVRVGFFTIDFAELGVARLPQEATDFVNRFDHYENPGPFHFAVELEPDSAN